MHFTITSLLGSAFICLTLIFTARRAGWLNRRDDLRAVQASHTRQVSRLGGVGIVAGAAAGIWFLPDTETRALAVMLFLSALPVFAAGLAEDLGYGVSPKGRLGAAAISSILAIVLTGTWIRASGLPGLDSALAILPFGLAITILWTCGLCHATNLIDGVNGLASSFATLAALSLAAMAWRADDAPMMAVALLMAPALLGFLVFNWPKGLIFLGDAGAYTLGHLLAWIGIMLAWRNPEVTGAAVVLVFFWPITDTLFAIYRRRRVGKPFDQPDRMHVHQIVMRWLEAAGLGRRRRYISNPATTVLLLPFIAGPILVATVMSNRPIMALTAFALFGVGFVTFYRLGARFAQARYNPIDMVRSVPTVPVQIEALIPTNPPASPTDPIPDWLEPAADVRLIRHAQHSYWQALICTQSGQWLRLDRRFNNSGEAQRAAVRAKVRSRLVRRSVALETEDISV